MIGDQDAIERLRRYLKAYDDTTPSRERLVRMYAEAETSGDYSDADEYSAGLNETLADIADDMASGIRQLLDHIAREPE